jgi:hypothetical protein
MMKKVQCIACKDVIVAILMLVSTAGWSQQLSQTVRCRITDSESKAPLFGASFIMLDTGVMIGASSDLNGSVEIIVPVGRRSFKVSYIGYEDFYFREVLVTAGKELDLNVGLRERMTMMKGVVVQGNNDKSQSINQMAVVSTRQLSIEEGQRYAGGFYDPARMVSSFSGVTATEGDGSNQIVIRGNSPRGLLWRLEGVEIPNPNHFPDGQGDAGGAFCILNSEVLSNFDFYTSAFPAEFGNAYSGIMDIGLRKGNASRREYSVIFGLVGTQVSAEGPFVRGKQASYLVTYRYSNFGLLNRAGMLGLAENHLPPLFQDLNFNINFPMKRYGNLTLFGSAGKSWTGWEAYQDSARWQSWDDRKDDTEIHRMGVTGMKYIYPFRNLKTYIKIVAAATHQGDDLSTSFVMDDYSILSAYRNEFAYNAIRANVMIQHKFNARHSFRGGLIYNRLISEMYAGKYNWTDSLFVTSIDKANRTSLLQSYIQWKYRITESTELISGLHTMYFDLNSDYSVEPRIAFKWQFSKNQSLSLGTGLHSRTESIPVYFASVMNSQGQFGEFNRNLRFTKSLQGVAGYDIRFNKDLRCRVEAYIQHIFNVPVVDTTNSTMSALNFSFGIPEVALANKGIGRNFGLEITIEKFYSNHWYFLLTSSLFESKYLANNDIWYNTTFNNRHVSNFLVGKDFQTGKYHQNTIGVNIKALVRGGFRYTPIDFDKSVVQGDEVYIWEKSFQEQYPLYYRFDLGMSYQQNKPGYNWSVALNIYNVLNYKNILAYEMRHYEKTNAWKLVGIEGLGIVPNLNFKIDF